MEIVRRVNSEALVIDGLRNLVGKKVKINIEVCEDEVEKRNETSRTLGSYNLGNELDDLNLRNFAYEEN